MTIIHREIYGQGRPLVMIHGWAMHTGIWRDFAKQLARRYQVICLDLPGHGRSDCVDSYRLPEIGAALLDAIPVRTFGLLGWSLGASVAIEMASLAPDRVTFLLMLAGNPKFVRSHDWPGVKPELLDGFTVQLNGDVRLMLSRFLALQINGLPDAKRLLRTMKNAVRECEPPRLEALRGGLDILGQGDLREKLRRLQCPVGHIQGDRDALIPLDCGLALQNLKPEIDVHVLENAGHVPFLTHERPLLDIIGGGL